MNTLAERHDSESQARAVDILYSTGFRLHAQERYRDAAQVFQVMLQAAPTDERGWLALADCHEKLGQCDIALELCSAGTLAAEPAPRCMLSRFRLLYDVGRMSEADEAYDAAVELAARIDDEYLSKSIQNERRVRP